MDSPLVSRIEHVVEAITQINTDAPTDLYTALLPKLALLNSISSSPNTTDSVTLEKFIRRYIESVPEYLFAFQALACTGEIEAYTRPFISAAIDCFLDEHTTIQRQSGTQAYLYRAYLCHRMLEELNDRVSIERGWPLAPSDNTYVNIIAHTLIGDSDANSLDQTILIRLEVINITLTDEEKEVFQRKKAQQLLAVLLKNGWQETINKWPILKEDIADILI